MEEDSTGFGVDGFLRKWGLLMAIGALVFFGSYILFGRKRSTGVSIPGLSSQPGANGQPVVEYVPTTGDTYTSTNTTTNTTTNFNEGTNQEPASPGGTTTSKAPPIPIGNSKPPSPPARPPKPSAHFLPPMHHATYSVVSGDTLESIAERHKTTWQILYNLNRSTIDSQSAQHGNPVPGGPWNNIFPDEKIIIPA